MFEIHKFKISPYLEKHEYKLLELINSGANGQCFTVFSEKYQQKFCCKCMTCTGSLGNHAEKIFDAEVQALSKFSHRNIVKIYDYFKEDNYMFMIIEYCERGSLSDLINQTSQYIDMHSRKIICWEKIRTLLYEILSAIEFCHNTQHLSHHDIKPSNIVIDSFGHAKLCDFGLSHIIGPYEALNQVISDDKNCSGSLLYMSPQLIECSCSPSASYDMFSADIWAFGVTAFEMCTCRFPFNGTTKREVMASQKERIGNQEKNIFRILKKDVPEDIQDVIKSSLVYEESERASATKLIEILKPQMDFSAKVLPCQCPSAQISKRNLVFKTIIRRSSFNSKKLNGNILVPKPIKYVDVM